MKNESSVSRAFRLSRGLCQIGATMVLDSLPQDNNNAAFGVFQEKCQFARGSHCSSARRIQQFCSSFKTFSTTLELDLGFYQVMECSVGHSKFSGDCGHKSIDWQVRYGVVSNLSPSENMHIVNNQCSSMWTEMVTHRFFKDSSSTALRSSTPAHYLYHLL